MSKTKQNHSRKPPLWATLLGIAVLSYLILQPIANRQFGWKLPSLAGLLENAQVAEPPGKKTAESNVDSTNEVLSTRSDEPPSDNRGQTSSEKPNEPRSERPRDNRDPSKPREQLRDNQTTAAADDSTLVHGILRDLGREEYLSPAGLRYTRGSAEGHRLKHLAKHLEDQPDRPGSHGVFHGDMPQVLVTLDEAYKRAQANDPNVNVLAEEGRMVYEVTFDRTIGYVGGQSGARRNHPQTKKLRMVLERDRLITAFPF